MGLMIAALAGLLFAAAPAQAEPVTAAIAAYLVTAGASAAVASIVASVIVYAAVALASYAIQSALAPGTRRPQQSELIRDLSRPQSLTPYRFAYGDVRLSGSPAPIHVQNAILWMCFILNSRPSEAVTEIYLDKRPFTWTGDIYDFNTGGVADGEFTSHAIAWVGLGDQTTPPALAISETGGVITSTDGWQGRTVLWLRLDAGANDTRASRWPRTPPEVEVRGQWSKVWNPSDGAQDADDPSTWTYTDNRSLCLLDALRTNPVRPYPLAQLDLASFISAGGFDEQLVTLAAGGSERRYRVGGVVIWGENELEDQIMPLVEAGASRLVRAGGKLGITTGVWDAPVYTVTDILDEGLTFETLRPGRDLATTVTASYMAPDRDWQMSAIAPYQVPGAQAADGGIETIKDKQFSAVTSATQARRLQKIDGLRNRSQKRLTCTLPPSALDVVAGSNVTVDLASPWDAMNGIYEVISIAPRLIAEDDQGVTARCAVELVETSEAIFAWVAADDEAPEPDAAPVYDPTLTQPGAPTGLALAPSSFSYTGEDFNLSLIVSVDHPTGSRETALEVEAKFAGGPFRGVGRTAVDRTSPGDPVTLEIIPVLSGVTYTVRARWLTVDGAGDWAETSGEYGVVSAAIDPPAGGAIDYAQES